MLPEIVSPSWIVELSVNGELTERMTELGLDHATFDPALFEAVTATAHKLARLIYRLIKHGEAYVQEGLEKYEMKNQQRKLRAVRKMAESLGLKILEPQEVTLSVS